MTDAPEAKPEKPKGCRVAVTRRTRGYPLGVCELRKAEAEALVAARVARYVK